MKIALITDTHFGARGDSPIFNEFFFKFWENIFFPYMKENNIKSVIHLGDVVDRRKFINHNIAWDFQNRFMKRLWKEGIDTHILIGNHDTYFKNTNKVNAIENLCTTYDGLNEPWIYSESKVVNFDGCEILFMPWINSGNYEESLKMINETTAPVCFGHFEIAGFQMYKGQVNEEGLDRKIFDKFDLVCSGHFHHKSTDNNIVYLGNTYEFTWSDYGDQKGFHIFDTDTHELTFVPNPYTIFHKIIYDETNAELFTEDLSKYKDAFIKLVVINKTDYYKFDKYVESLYNAQLQELKIIEDLNMFENEALTDEDIDVQDTVNLLSNYIDSYEIDCDKEKLKTVMKTLYVEAQNYEETN